MSLEAGAPPGDAAQRAGRRRRGRRGGRRRRGREKRSDGPVEPAAFDAEGHEPEEGAPREPEGDTGPAQPSGTQEGARGERRRRRGRRGGRGRNQGVASSAGALGTPVEPVIADDDELPPAGSAGREPQGSASDEADGRRRRKRGSRGGRRRRQKKVDGAVSIELIPGDVDELPELEDLPEDAVLVGAPAERIRAPARRAARGVPEEHDDDEDEDEDEEREAPRRVGPVKRRVILVNARDSEEKRVAVVEEGRIVDLQMTVKKHVSYVNDIYRGRVVNIESAIGAAFVDFGEGRNGFLHASDVLPSYGDPEWNLEKLLSTPLAKASEEDAGADEDEVDEVDPVEPAHDHDLPDEEGAATAELAEDGEALGAADPSDEDEDDEPAPALDGGRAEAPEDEDDEPVSGRASARGGRQARGRRVRVARHRARVRLPIDKLLKKGQMVAVQITKDAIGDKGPTLTTYISIPGRYLVLMPSLERTGVSRKIDDERERRRLKRILQSLDIPDGMGVIVRTAGIGRSKTEIHRDLEYLLLAWEDFSKRLRAGRNPAPLYQESDVAIRTMRDLFTPETEAVIVDDAPVFQRMVEFTKRLMPEHIERVRLHDGERPLFHSHGVEQDFEKIFARRVELPSGGSIVIEQTEALVAIDVNSGRTREEGAEFEDIALKTNLEAVPEIARQIRLRDLGGIIVLDFIDMMRASGRKAVERAVREALKADRARAKIGRISQFGLLELTRQRLGPGLSKLVYDSCPRCRGSGRRRNASSRAQAIMRRLAAALALKGYTTIEVRTHPDVIEYLQKELHGELAKLQEGGGREIKLLSVPEQVEDSVLHYLRADGREVRPGGRRRR
ncbi:MAG TPA: Rne/Rng family ribonuclease [Planctomycetota bacterium]